MTWIIDDNEVIRELEKDLAKDLAKDIAPDPDTMFLVDMADFTDATRNRLTGTVTPLPLENSPAMKACTAALLREAVHLITSYGWVQGRYGSCQTGMCAMGAIQLALTRYARNLPGHMADEEYNAIYLTMRSAFWRSQKISNIPTWNDALPCTPESAHTVMDTLSAVADYLDE